MNEHASTRIEIGARVRYDGETHTLTELLPTATGTDVVLRTARAIVRLSLVTLLEDVRAHLIPTTAGPSPTDDLDPAAVILGSLDKAQTREIRRRCDHIREMLTGYRSGSAALALPQEPRPQYATTEPLLNRYAAKAHELGFTVRHVRRMAKAYKRDGEAGLASARWQGKSKTDPRWVQTVVSGTRCKYGARA